MPENKKILLLGTGGHGLSVLDSLVSLSEYDEIGLVVKDEEMLQPDAMDGLKKYGVLVTGNDSDLEVLFHKGYQYAFVAVGSIGDTSVRRKLYVKLKKIGFVIPNIIDKTSVVSKTAVLGEGIFIGKKAVVNAGASLGNCSIINTACVIEHECRIGDFVHIAPGSILCGSAGVEADTHIGAGCILKQGVKIGSNSMIGMGSVVLKDFGSKSTAFGSPCKEVNHG